MPTPKPTPTKLKILKGNPGKRPLPKDEVEPPVPEKVPQPPAHLDRYAAAEWQRMAEKLHTLGLLTDVDDTALGLYCAAYGRWAHAEEMIQLFGVVQMGAGPGLSKSPYVSIAAEAMRDCHKYLTEFGMTPSSRTKVKAAPKSQKSKFTGLIGGKVA